MSLSALPRLAAAMAMGLAASSGAAVAASPGDRVIAVPPGAVVLILQPGGAPVMAGPPALEAGFADPFALLRRVDQMMERAFVPAPQDGLIEAAMQQMQSGAPLTEVPVAGLPVASGPMTGFVVTTVSNARGSCTRQVVYSGNPAAPKVEMRMTGSACDGGGVPAALPTAPEPAPARPPLPRTWRVERNRATPIQVAQLDR